MQTVTNEQIYDRWEQVPEALKEAFFSLENGEAIWKTCEEVGLSNDAIDQVLMVIGNILLGFTHINDLAKELQSIPGIDLKSVDPIIFQADRKIFAPIKGEILKLYSEMSGEGPRIVAEAPTRTVSASVSMEAPAMIAAAEESKDARSGQAEIPGVQVEIRKVRIGEEMGGVTPITEAKPEEVPIVAPTIIHAEAELQPVMQKKRSLSSFGGMFGFKRAAEKKEGTPVVAAQVSMAGGMERKPEAMARTEQQPVRVVHYTSAKAPEDIFAKEVQPQKEAATIVPVTKQEHLVDFEPKMVDLTHAASVAEAPRTVGETQAIPSPQPEKIKVPVPAMPEENGQVAAMPKTGQAIVMKTPQRTEAPVTEAQPQKEPRLAEIPVADDIVDLRMLERVDKQTEKK